METGQIGMVLVIVMLLVVTASVNQHASVKIQRPKMVDGIAKDLLFVMKSVANRKSVQVKNKSTVIVEPT